MRGHKEAKVWKHITVENRHQLSYRSDAQNAFIKKLDRRSDSATGNHAKFVGTPTKKSVPKGVKNGL